MAGKRGDEQRPLVRLLDGGSSQALLEWESRAEMDLGVLIRRYLCEHPCPGESQVAADLGQWAAALTADGQARLEDLGLRPFYPCGAQADRAS